MGEVFKDVVAQHVELQERIKAEIDSRRREIASKQKASEKHNRTRSIRMTPSRKIGDGETEEEEISGSDVESHSNHQNDNPQQTPSTTTSHDNSNNSSGDRQQRNQQE